MEIIPVVDIKGGDVVQAIRGQRDKYLPVQNSKLVKSSDPLKVAEAFIQKFNFKKFYIADLDSIENKGNNFSVIEKLKRELGIKMMVDIGIKDKDDLDKNVIKHIDWLILGTETLSSLDTVDYVMKLKNSSRITASIDLKGRELQAKYRNFANPRQAINKLNGLGVENFIILDLSWIGTLKGPSIALKELIENFKDKNLVIFTGGGISSVDEVKKLKEIGVSGALIGTAFHRGLIKKDDIFIINR
ncbi:MAG: HisA/HisF-related TIM barrel protein [Candidatus Saelkia tenebricola]|nr:HisA/HisF-related TIM barrel protein [Candidatus Saelkia tenebricola]